MDLIDDDEPAGGGNAPELTVSEISGAVKRTIEDAFGRVRVRAEVGRVFRARSGHLYFDLKDDRSVLAAVAWKGQVAGLTVVPEEGMEVVASGQLTTFGSQSKYQLNADDVRHAGTGALMAQLERRKTKLAAEGLFDEARKRPLPFLPDVIGVVTSPAGAVIRDILHRLADRFPRHVLIWPVAVQGRGSAEQVAGAIAGFDAIRPGGAVPRPDLVIVARGGGSIEDLWGFNEEVVARAAAACSIPLISAVGHETDTTLIDYVADRRAPTPTAAAEMAVPVRLDLMAWTSSQEERLRRALREALGGRRQRLADLARALPRPEGLTAQAAQRLDHAAMRLPQALRGRVDEGRVRLSRAEGRLTPAALSSRMGSERLRVEAAAERLGPALSRRVAAEGARLDGAAERLEAAHGRALREARRRLGMVRLDGSAPGRVLAARSEAFGALAGRLSSSALAGQERRVRRLGEAERLLGALGYKATLARGYAVVRSEDRVVTRKAEAERARALAIEFADGVLRLGQTPKRRRPASEDDQPTLL